MKWALGAVIEDGTMKPVLLHLAWLHTESQAPFPSQQTLAAATGNSSRTVREALRLLEHFRVIQRRARSNGSTGRSSDLFTLAIGKTVNLTRNQILVARRGLRKRRTLPVASSNSQPANIAGGPGEVRQGIGDDQLSIQGNVTQGSKSALGGGLRLLPGGRS